METQTDAPSQSRDDDLHEKMDKLANCFDNVEKRCDEYKTSLEFTQEEVKELKEENTSLKESLKELSLEVQRNIYAIQKLNNKQGNVHETVCQLFSEMKIAKPMDYNAAYRLGSKPGRYPRPILISFIRQDDRNLVYAKRTQLRNSQHLARVWVSEDVTPQTRRARNIIREVAKEACNHGARCQAMPNNITINN